MQKSYTRKLKRSLAITSLLTIAVVAFTLVAVARTSNTISITVQNSSHRDIHHLYLAAGDPNNWGPDQLHGSIISQGQSYVLSDVACGGGTIRVIAEDQNGCFVYFNASCDANQNWEITDGTAPDCGGGSNQ